VSKESRIRLALPFTDDDEITEIRGVLTSGYLTQGPKVAEFELLVRAQTGAKWAFAMSSCTTALHLSLVVSGIRPDDEVLVPDFTFPAAANVVIQERAMPVLVDIHPETMDLDVEDAVHLVRGRLCRCIHSASRPTWTRSWS
jgi:perosamine synthetase